MENKILLTIITPVYNCEKYIIETIDSVLKYASGINYEYIVVNDGSIDNTLVKLKHFGKQIELIDQENQGESTAINNALRIAQGKYCLVVSADDPLCSSDLFKISFSILENDVQVVVTYPDWFMIDFNGNFISKIETSNYSEETLLGKFKCIPGPGAIFRTSVAKEVGGRDPSYKFVSDYDLWLKLSRHGYFQRIPLPLAQWRYHDDSTSIKLRGFRMANERILVIQNFLKYNSIDVTLSKSAIAHSYYHAAMLAYFTLEVPGKEWIRNSFRSYGKWIPGIKIKVVIYLFLLPYSFYFVEQIRKIRFLRKLIPQA